MCVPVCWGTYMWTSALHITHGVSYEKMYNIQITQVDYDFVENIFHTSVAYIKQSYTKERV